jgi:hypothetical protein
MSFGFIITRHVTCENTNKYWNQNVKLLRLLYPLREIVIIDDNSNQDFVKADCDYKNVKIIQSEYKGSGEILPYIYFLKNKWFTNAVILHDSVFLHKRIPFNKITEPIIPLWDFKYDKENLPNMLRIVRGLKNNFLINQRLTSSHTTVLGFNNNNINDFVCCFGVQSFINHSFLCNIENKYGFTNLVNYVKNRSDRCAMERIMGLLFTLEYPKLLKYKSLFGNIHKIGNWGYTYQEYEENFKKNKVLKIAVKVWTGR